jgi:hypothetical protein
MSGRFLAIGGFEASIIWRFLDGVSAAVSTRMAHGSPPAEENLTFLLCELLDANATSLHALRYPLSQVQTDLAESDSGMTLEVEFQTHEHSKYVESRYSGADLGIVLAISHPVFGQSRRGVLVQAKRLFSQGRKREYGLFSEYASFDKKQAEFLNTLANRFGVWNSVFYLWYNPPSTAFPDVDAKILRAYEAGGFTAYQYWHRMHPFIDEMIEMGFPWHLGGNPRIALADEEAKAREWRLTQPALRVSGLDVARSVGEHGPPRLKSLYDATLERQSSPTFWPFADFFVLALATSRYGSDNADWLRLTEGQKVPMPAAKQTTDSSSELDGLESPPTPRHTLRITIRSTLPQVG